MPTSSQALALLKHITDSNWGGSASTAASISACHLPNVFPQRYEEKADADPTSNLALRVHGEVLQQRPQGRSCGSELVLPPINHSAKQSLTLVTRDPRKISETACNNKQPTRKKLIQGIDEHELTLTENCSHVSINIIDASQLPQNEEAEAARTLQERTHGNSELRHAARHEQKGLPFLSYSNFRTMPAPAQCSQSSVPANTPDLWTQGEPSLSQDAHDAMDTSCKKSVLTCVLNLNLWDQSCDTHYDNSSCIGILSYNHQMGRHEWSLVPQNSPVPFRAVRGRYLKNKNSADCSVMSAVPDQSGNFDDGPQDRKGSDTDIWTEPVTSQLSNNAGDEDMVDEQQLSRQGITDRLQARQPDDVYSGPLPTHFNFGNSLRKQNHHPDTGHDTLQFQQRTRSEKLTPSGIIYNESYVFGKEDGEDIVPHFLETLIRTPKAGEEMDSPYLANISGLGHSSGVPSAVLKCHGCKVAQRSALNQRRPAKVQSTAHKTTHHKVTFKSQQPSEPAQGKLQSPKHNYKAESHMDKREKGREAAVSDQDPGAHTETSTPMSSPAEPRVLRMRTELPPSHPNRLCFRTTLSGCSHMEVLNEIESQKNVKVTWLQYEPISLHYTDIARPDYRHLCMWMFELSSDSDASRLLLEGFMLRGHHMNVLHLDDVYLEEFRTFSLCNEIFMEQRSKHLISNKAKRLVKASIYYQ